MLIMKILAFVFIIPGIVLVFSAREAVKRFELDKKVTCSYENEMSEEEIAQYKKNRAVVNFKMIGALIALPGFILALIAFK